MIIGNEATICIDVDDTLIFWDENSYGESSDEARVPIVDPNDGMTTNHTVHFRHVQFLKKQYHKGFTVIVWSASGAKWAGAVVKALGLEKYVTACLTKPCKYVDDYDEPDKILGTHVYLDPKGFSL
jgi:hydroxymethylpyrimidine pyrophosphatase-like HAD family hydrolase